MLNDVNKLNKANIKIKCSFEIKTNYTFKTAKFLYCYGNNAQESIKEDKS